jgi:hypothetical protein
MNDNTYTQQKTGTLSILDSQKVDIDNGMMFASTQKLLSQDYFATDNKADGTYSVDNQAPINDFKLSGVDLSQYTKDGFRNDSTGALERKNSYIDAEKNRIKTQEGSHDWKRMDHFSIGTVYLKIPPTQINVSNESHNYRHSTLRSPGEVVLSSGRSTTRIEIDVIFSGLDDINNKLRPILAQFKTTPFLPIESDYLRIILNPFNRGLVDRDYLTNLQSQYRDMQKRNAVVNGLLAFSAQKDIKQSKINEYVDHMKSNGYITEAFRQQLQIIMPDPKNHTAMFSKEDYKADGSLDLQHFIRRNMTVDGKNDPDMVTLERSLADIDKVKGEIDDLNKRSGELMTQGVSDRYKDRQLVCVLSQASISTTPGFPETLSCRFSLYVFNYDPYTLDFAFISGYNNKAATPDITKCDMFIDWYTKRWLSANGSVERPSLEAYNTDETMIFSYFSKINPVSADGRYNPDDIKTESFAIAKGIVPTGITASLKNVIQFIPILSCSNPTCQYMGSMNSEVMLTFECTSADALNRMTKMLERVAVISRTVNRVTRFNYIYIQNSLLAFMGMPFFTVENYSIDTSPGNPGLYLINISLVEYKVGQEQFQELKREGVTSQKQVEYLARYVLDQAREWARKPTSDRYYFDKVDGWFAGNPDFIAQFVGGDVFWTTGDVELRDKIMMHCEDLRNPFGYYAGEMYNDAKKKLTTPAVQSFFGMAEIKVPSDRFIDRYSYNPIAPGQSFNGGMLKNRDWKGYGKKFFNSIKDSKSSGSQMFYEDNADLVAKVLASMRRDELVNMILNDEQKKGINALLNNATVGGKNVRSKDEIDAGKTYCYPDLELPKFGELPNGVKLKTTMEQNGSTRGKTEASRSVQSDFAEVDPDFYIYRGSMWGTLSSNSSLNEAVRAGVNKYKGLAESNRNYRRYEAANEEDMSALLARSKVLDTEDKIDNSGKKFVDQGLRKKIEGKPVKVVGIHDGDTISVEIEGKPYNVRVLGYDAPEVSDSATKKVNDKQKAELAATYLASTLGFSRDSSGHVTKIPGNRSQVYLSLGDGELLADGRIGANVSVSTGDEVKGDVRQVSDLMLKHADSMGITYYPSPDNPQDALAQETYMKSHELYVLSLLRKDSFDKEFKSLYSKVPSFLGANEGALGDIAKIIQGVGSITNSTTARLQAITQAVTGIVMHPVAHMTPGFLFNAAFPENVIANDVNETIAKAATNVTNNRGLRRFDRELSSNIELLSSKIIESQKDDTWRLSRAFPAFKVYFIEEDMPEWGRLDDLYSYHAVASIDITRSRTDPADTAVITFFNTKGTLDRSLFGLYDPQNNFYTRSQDENYDPRNQETKIEQELEEFILKPGTVIKIKMGYSSDPELLDTVFTGMVAEVSGGDMINVIAQGFGVELLQPVPFSSRQISAAGASKVLNLIITDPVVKHFGKTEWWPVWDDTTKTIFRRNRWNSVTKQWESKSWWRRIAGIDYLLRLRNSTADDNIWTHETGFWYSLSHGGFQSLVLKDKTIWDVFMEMQRRNPGYIAAVLPFDNRATVFFGPSEFMYTYTATKAESNKIALDAVTSQLDLTSDLKRRLLVDNYGYTVQSPDKLSEEANALSVIFKKLDKGGPTYSLTPYRENLMVLESVLNGDMSQANRAISFLDTYANAYTYSKGDVDSVSNQKRLQMLSRDIKAGKVGKSGLFSMSTNDVTSGKYDFKPNPEAGKTIPGEVYISKNGDRYSKDLAVTAFNDTVSEDLIAHNKARRLLRNYHYKDSYHHIVGNNIVATSQYMYNKVTVEFGNEKAWKEGSLLTGTAGFSRVSAQIDDDIWPERLKEKIVQERNANDIITAWHYALGHLWEETRKMYSGNLILLGDASIKPNDIIMMTDYFTDMYGPIEVEQVTHHFSPETGFVTTITPNLVCSVNNPLQQGSLTVAGTYMDKSSEFVQAVREVFAIGTPLVSNYAAGVAFWMSSLTSARREPISLSPLIYAGRPYIAGVEGMRKNTLVEAISGNLTRFLIQTRRIVGTGGSMLEYLKLRASANNPRIVEQANKEGLFYQSPKAR